MLRFAALTKYVIFDVLVFLCADGDDHVLVPLTIDDCNRMERKHSVPIELVRRVSGDIRTKTSISNAC